MAAGLFTALVVIDDMVLDLLRFGLGGGLFSFVHFELRFSVLLAFFKDSKTLLELVVG